MIKKYYKIFAFWGILFGIFLLSGNTAKADSIIADGAGLLSSDEANKLESACKDIELRYQTCVYIITSSEIGKNNHPEKYVRSIAKDEHAPENLVILFVSSKKNQQFCIISRCGNATKTLTQKRCDKLERRIQSAISDKQYYTAFDTFCDETLVYLGRKPMLDAPFFATIPQLIFSVLLTCGILFLILRDETARMDLCTYMDKKLSKILERSDDFSHVTQEKSDSVAD